MDLKPTRDWLTGLSWIARALIALLAVGVVFSIAMGWYEAAGLLGGILLGALLLLRFPPAVAGVQPLRAFLVELRPLVLPLVIVLIAGTVAYSWIVPLLVVPVLLIGGWYLLVAPEVTPTRTAFADTAGWLRKGLGDWGHILIGALVLLVCAALFFLVWGLSPDVGLYEDRPGLSNALITFALASWMLAVILRLGGFSTSWFRMVVAAISILAAARVLMEAGLLPGHNWLIRNVGWLDSSLLLGLTLIGLAVISVGDAVISLIPRLSRLPELGAFPMGVGRTLRGLGFAVAVVATVFLGGAALFGVIDSETGGHDPVTSDVTAGTVVNPEGLSPKGLANPYQPVLVMTDDERWAPVDVRTYLSDRRGHPASMVRPNGKVQRAPKLEDLPTSCHGARPPCFQITINCEHGSDDCAEGQLGRGDPDFKTRPYRDGADYVRIITRERPGGSPQAFNGTGHYGKQLQTLIQYWYFYRYDEWTRPVLGGRIVQRHEGDWEAVSIGFSKTEPLFVAYSAHCGGTWVPWGKADLAATGPPRVHPLVAVAEGSHANYTHTQDRRAPDWAGCKGVPQGSTTALSYASNLRDETSFGWSWLPATVHYVNNSKPPMNFPGTWGGNDYTELSNFRSQRLGPEGRGPATPSLQPLWYDPIATIFCSKHWHGPERCGE